MARLPAPRRGGVEPISIYLMIALSAGIYTMLIEPHVNRIMGANQAIPSGYSPGDSVGEGLTLQEITPPSDFAPSGGAGGAPPAPPHQPVRAGCGPMPVVPPECVEVSQ